MPRCLVLLLVLVGSSWIAGCGTESDDGQPRLAYVTNGVADFWTVAAAGVRAGEKEFGAHCEVLMPKEGVQDQQQILENLLARGVEGIAISPISGEHQAGFLDRVAAATHLITHDSDAPGTKRLAFVGVDNYAAGREAGKLVEECLPGGGEVMIFVGRIGQDNARLRRQGVIDQLLGRSFDSKRYDEPGVELGRGGKYVIVDTRDDGFSPATAKANAEGALTAYPNLAVMVGLFAYNPPACLSALASAGKLGTIKVVAFDEDVATLDGIEMGTVVGTVVQQPFEYGRQSVRILAGLARGDRSVLPPDGVLTIPALVLRKPDVPAFRRDLEGKLAAGR